MPDRLLPRGQDLVSAIIEWSKREITDASSTSGDLGKFFFTVSSGSAGLIVTLAKLGQDPSYAPGPFVVSMALYLASAVVSITMVQPRVWRMGANTDLFQEYRASIRRILVFMWSWFAFWLAATTLGAVALFL